MSDSFIISKDESGIHRDKLVVSRFLDHSRTYFQYLIENGSILVNGKSVKKRETTQEGDEVEICFILTPELSLEPQNIPLDILYEDEHLLAINKPAGMVVHPAPGHPSNTFANALLFHCKQLPSSKDSLRPGIVHRLDKETTGILLAAKDLETHAKLIAAFSNREVEKHYLTICLGNPGNKTIDAPIGRHPTRRKEMAVSEKGKPALSRCCVQAFHAPFALVDITLITGRTHQIRVHLKHLNCPILGDPLYGSAAINKKYAATRQMLHAHSLRFKHPHSQKTIEIEAPLPEDFFSNKTHLHL